jgi:hypothetical protein
VKPALIPEVTMKVNVLIARFPWHGAEHPDATDWLIRTAVKMKADPRIGEVHNYRLDDTPITMCRNRALRRGQELGVDYTLMLDSDMSPELPVPLARPFWDTSFAFALGHEGPCCVAAPYCGPPPVSNVYVFRWANWQNPDVNPNPDMRLEPYAREEAAGRAGIEEVAALPTGLILIDMRALGRLEPPYFRYEWKDATESEKASTEDVVFTRDLSLRGVRQYVNWDAWAGHWKPLRVDKPRVIYTDHVQEKYRAAVLADLRADERLLMVGEGGRNGPQGRALRSEEGAAAQR